MYILSMWAIYRVDDYIFVKSRKRRTGTTTSNSDQHCCLLDKKQITHIFRISIRVSTQAKYVNY